MQLPPTLANLINVAITLVGIYFSFALLASWLNERFATWLQLRSKNLLAGIEQIVGDESKDGILGSPFIRTLTSEQTSMGSNVTKGILPAGLTSPAAASSLRRPPSYVSAAQFTSAIVEWLQRQRAANMASVRTGIAGTTVGALPAPIPADLQALAAANPGDAALSRAIERYIPPVDLDAGQKTVWDALQDLATGKSDVFTTALAADADNAGQELVTLLNALPEGNLRKQLLAIFRTAEGDVGKFVTGVEGWFDDAMDRVSGWYKRANQKIVLAIGFVLVLAFNIDTIGLFQKLNSNVKLAAQGAIFGQALGSNPQGAKLDDILRPACPALPGGKTPDPAQLCPTCHEGYNAAKGYCELDQSFLSQIPIGWPADPLYEAVHKTWPHRPQWPANTPGLLVLKLVGLLLSAIAIAQGAPFWFDLLGKVTSVRSAGPKPATDAKDSGAAS